MAEGSINNMMQKVLQCTFALSLAFDPSLAAQAVISSFQSMQVESLYIQPQPIMFRISYLLIFPGCSLGTGDWRILH